MLRIDHQYKNSFIPNGTVLLWDAYSKYSTTIPLFSCPLLILKENEFNLNNGRFINFNKNLQKYKIIIPAKDFLINIIENYVNIINNINIKGQWNISLNFHHINNEDIIFSFNKKSDAILFKLYQ